jgi:hypothetical protein
MQKIFKRLEVHICHLVLRAAVLEEVESVLRVETTKKEKDEISRKHGGREGGKSPND